MDPTGLPTDSMYKFWALGCLVMAGFCIWLCWKLFQQRRQDRLAIDEVLARAQARVQGARFAVERLEAEVEQFELGAKEAKNEETNRFYVQLQVDCRNQIKAQHARADEMIEELDALKARSTAMKEAHQTSHWMQRGLAVIAGISFTAANIGFVVWYNKAQRYQDRAVIVDEELKLLELELKRIELKAKLEKANSKKLPLK